MGKRRPGGVLLLLGTLLILGPAVARAQTADLDAQVRAIAADLRCPVCENLSVADSPSPLAGQMRDVIRQQLRAGAPREAILQYFVARYGDGILLNPSQRGFSLLVWLGAIGAVGAGALLLVGRVRRALRAGAAPAGPAARPLAAEEQTHYEAVLDAALARYEAGDPRC